MNELTLHKQKARLTRELSAWQAGAFGLLALSTVWNIGQAARIGQLEAVRRETAAQLEQTEEARDYAVTQLGAAVRQAEQEKQARMEQAAAFEAVGAWEYVGVCTITAYCPCAECCGQWADGLTATGLEAVPGIVAVDPEVIPLGSTVVIDGQKYLAADTGVTGNHVDVCVSGHQEAEEFGVQTEQVWVIAE